MRLDEERATVVKRIELPDGGEALKFVREAVQAFPELYFSRFVGLGDRRRLHGAGRRRDRFRRKCSARSRQQITAAGSFVEAEQDPAKAPPLVYARRGFAYLSAALRDMGW